MTSQKTNIGLISKATGATSVQRPDERQLDHCSIQRLIVLVPNRPIDQPSLARRIWTLSEPCQIPVLFLGLGGKEGAEESNVRLRLTTLAAMTGDDAVRVETCVEPEDGWVRAVHHHIQPGDAVICLAEHMIALRFRGRHPLSQVIEYILDVPVYVLPGLFVTERVCKKVDVKNVEWIQRLASVILVPILIAACFLVVQLRIGMSTVGLARTGLLCATGVVEVGLIDVWRRLSH